MWRIKTYSINFLSQLYARKLRDNIFSLNISGVESYSLFKTNQKQVVLGVIVISKGSMNNMEVTL